LAFGGGDEKCVALRPDCCGACHDRRGAADPPLVPSIYKAPVAVREPAPWTGLYGDLNAGYGRGNQPVRETAVTATVSKP